MYGNTAHKSLKHTLNMYWYYLRFLLFIINGTDGKKADEPRCEEIFWMWYTLQRRRAGVRWRQRMFFVKQRWNWDAAEKRRSLLTSNGKVCSKANIFRCSSWFVWFQCPSASSLDMCACFYLIEKMMMKIDEKKRASNRYSRAIVAGKAIEMVSKTVLLRFF